MDQAPAAKQLASQASAPALNITCHPALNSTTIFPEYTEETVWTVLLECHASIDPEQWEVAVWHNFNFSSHWESLGLARIVDQSPVDLSETGYNQQVSRQYFQGRLIRSPSWLEPVRFTVKYRAHSSSPWRWANEDLGLQDGELIFRIPVQHHFFRGLGRFNHAPYADPAVKTLEHYIDHLNPALTVKGEVSEVPQAALWSISMSASASEGKLSAYTDTRIGQPNFFSRWFALVRLWTPWLSPEHGRSFFSPHRDVVLCSFLRYDGSHLACLALSGIDDTMAVLKSDGKGSLVCLARNDGLEAGTARVLVSVAPDHERAVAAVMYHARKLVEAGSSTEAGQSANRTASGDDVKVKWMQNWYDGLSYCTWNSLGQRLSEDLILDALKTLKEADIKVSNVIIDDNWQSLVGLLYDVKLLSVDVEQDNYKGSQYSRGWQEFEANREGFPYGLKHTVSLIREQNPHIGHVAVWHALLGYWGGIAPHGKLDSEYQTVDVTMRITNKHPGGVMRVVAAEDVNSFYEDFYRYLSESGITSVKTDAQFFLDEIEEAEHRRSLTKAYQDAWTTTRLRWFADRGISSMSQTPQIMFHSQLPTSSPRILIRNSDDFFPDVPASHPWHIFCNAHNAILTQHLHALPDWDMFQTSHAWASYHAAARCLSGGPIYITDRPGEHDMGVIKQMTARSVYGQTVILRPDVAGKTTQAYTSYDEQAMLRIGTYVGFQDTGTGMLGLFNGTDKTLTDFVSVGEIPGLVEGPEYVVRAHPSGLVSPVLQAVPASPPLVVSLAVKGWLIMSAFRVHRIIVNVEDVSASAASGPSAASGTLDTIKLANMGLLGKMTGAAAVIQTNLSTDSKGQITLTTSLKALGTLGVYISTTTLSLSIKKNFLIMLNGNVMPLHTIRKSPIPTKESANAVIATSNINNHEQGAQDKEEADEDFVLISKDLEEVSLGSEIGEDAESAAALPAIGRATSASGHDQPGKEDAAATKHEGPFILEMDLEAAWLELQLQPGWSNEVVVDVLLYYA